MKKLILILFLPVALSAQGGYYVSSFDQSQLIGQVNGISTEFSFLRISPDARAGGMGDGSVALSNDANAMYWNASRLAFNKNKFGYAISYAPWLRALVPDLNHFYMATFIKPDSVSAIGLSCTYFSLGTIGAPWYLMATKRSIASAMDLSYSRKVRENISVGLTVRYFLSANYPVYNLTAFGFSGDASLSWVGNAFESGKWNGNFQSGLAITNIGPKVTSGISTDKEFIPTNLAIAFGGEFEKDQKHFLAFQLEVSKLLVPSPPIYAKDSNGNPIWSNGGYVIAAGKDPNRTSWEAMFGSFNDSPYGAKGELHEIIFSAGVEYDFKHFVKTRSGVFYEHNDNGNRKFVSFGIGGRYKCVALDVSYWLPFSPYQSPLRHTMKFTLLIDLKTIRKST